MVIRCSKCKFNKSEDSFYKSWDKLKKKNRKQSWCKKCSIEYQNEWKKSHPKIKKDRVLLTEEERKIRNKANQKNYRDRLRLQVFNFYCENKIKCSCCGEAEIGFLSLDHIEGGGNSHRKEIGFGTQMYVWIIKNNYPKIFQVMCYNCNLSKGFLGNCPHKMVSN